MRNGRQYMQSLRDGRTVLLDGTRVRDVTQHPAFAGIIATIARMYDTAADPDSDMTAHDPHTGRQTNKVFMIPRSREDLAERRRAITLWAEISKGFVGRGPDHVGSFLAGFASAPEIFDTPHFPFGKNVTQFYRAVVAENLYVTYVIIPPQVDRSTTAHGWHEEFLQVGVVKEHDGGIVVRGAQMLGTATAVSDYLFVSCIKPLTVEDERYALSFVVPVSTPGLKVYCRRPYATAQPSSFDYPLSTHFDESDALIVFDDVFVPWERVFVYRDVERLRRQFFETAAHALGNNQAQIRLVVKLKFLLGLARKIAHVNGIDAIPSVQEKLGELASLAALVEGMVLASEASCVVDRFGVARPNPRFLYGAMGLQAELYPRVVLLLRELAGGGMIQLPSSNQDLTSQATRADVERYYQSPRLTASKRIQLFKLAWDATGSEFAGRHLQYEMFYAGAPFVAKGYAFRNYGYEEAIASVEEFLERYGPESVPAETAASPD
ncbi:MAG TPA: 4-hydroxyphenylacetate 3-hydroxylase N-terminal domain-containing protein [Bryobacteraceae bacterium]|nr:4-hydroxyphenylacetate 3-hydroxylase N-terminal domain-containing protein [Bryobacteraceae bacterium]